MITATPILYKAPNYDPTKDFVPITHIGVGPLLLAVNPGVAATTVPTRLHMSWGRHRVWKGVDVTAGDSRVVCSSSNPVSERWANSSS